MPKKCGIRVCSNSPQGDSLKEEGRRKEPKGPQPTSRECAEARDLARDQIGGKCRVVSLKKRSMPLSVPRPGSNYGIAGRWLQAKVGGSRLERR